MSFFDSVLNVTGTWSCEPYELTFTSPKGGSLFAVLRKFTEGGTGHWELLHFEQVGNTVTLDNFIRGGAPLRYALRSSCQEPRFAFLESDTTTPSEIYFELKADGLLAGMKRSDGKVFEWMFKRT